MKSDKSRSQKIYEAQRKAEAAAKKNKKKIDSESRKEAAKLFEEERLASEYAKQRVELIDADKMDVQTIEWLWDGHVAKGKFHLLAGAAGTGKTTIACHLAACVSAGIPFPFGNASLPGVVLIWSCEDDASDTLLPRLIAAGANTENIKFIGDVKDEINGKRGFDPATDIKDLEKRIAEMKNLAMIIIDPIVMAVSGDSHKNAEVRRGLDPLVRLSALLKVALIGITHYNKGSQSHDPADRVIGSVGYNALARVTLATAIVPASGDEGETRLLARIKANNSVAGGGFNYSLEECTIDNNVVTTRVNWLRKVEGTPQQLMQLSESRERPLDDAAEFLRDLLYDGDMRVAEIFRQAAEVGFSRDQMRRAKAKIGAKRKKIGFQGGYWVWSLPVNEGSEDCDPREPRPSLSSSSNSAVEPF